MTTVRGERGVFKWKLGDVPHTSHSLQSPTFNKFSRNWKIIHRNGAILLHFEQGVDEIAVFVRYPKKSMYDNHFTVRRALPWPPNEGYYNVSGNRGVRLWLTVTPRCYKFARLKVGHSCVRSWVDVYTRSCHNLRESCSVATVRRVALYKLWSNSRLHMITEIQNEA